MTPYERKKDFLPFSFALVLGMSFALAPAASAAPLSLDAYLGQVIEGNQGLRAANLSSTAADEKAGEASLAFSPRLEGSATYRYDEQTPFPLGYESMQNWSYQFGLAYQTPIGLKSRAYYKLTTYEARGFTAFINPSGIEPFKYYEGSMNFELALSLWNNLFGRGARAQRNAAEAGTLATKYGESYKAKSLLLASEAGYWKLALARESLKTAKDAVETALKMLNWAKRRSGLQLGDRSDVYQMEAAYQLRLLQLEQSTNEERSAALAFNSTRGSNAEEVKEELVELAPDTLVTLQLPERAQFRDDVKSA